MGSNFPLSFVIFKRLSSVVVIVVLSAVPSFSHARPISEIVDRTATTITRANFLSWSVESFAFTKDDDSCTLPFVRIPRGLKATLCIAQSKGILDVFKDGSSYTLSKPITRGEALIVLMMFTDKTDTDADVTMFKDVKSERMKSAVRSAITYKWMLPIRSNYFGVDRPLMPEEAQSALEAAAGQGANSKIPSFTVRLNGKPVTEDILPKQDLLESVWQLLQRDYLHSDTIDRDEAAYKMIEALTSSTGDPYTTFFRPSGADNFAQQLKGEISGIGAQVEEKDGIVTIISPLPGSPAERAGLQVRDQILEADGHVLKGLGIDKAVQFIRGIRGTSVHLKISRGGVVLEIDVVRDIISIPEIDVKWQGDIAIILLTQFGETTQHKIRSIILDVAKKNPRGLILDLRNNGGGLLSAADEVLSNFLPKNTVVAKVKSKNETRDEVTQADPTIPAETKMVVLVNKGSASASEIVAGALQDLKRATVLGTQTFGKGTVQEVLSFPTGEAIKITIAEWLTPLERQLQGVGVKPDIVLDTEDRDAQLKRALDILR